MKSHISLSIIILFLLISCEKEKKSIPKKEQTIVTEIKVVDTIVPKKVVSHESETIKNINLTSKLAEKVTRLAQLEHKYVLKSLEIVQPKKTVLLGHLQYVATLKDSTSKVIDFKSIKNTIHEIRKAFLKGTKPMHPNGNTFPRVTIEEYIFKTSESAKIAFKALNKSEKNRHLWKYLKSPNALFLEENNIYFVNSGGYYMMGIYEDIVEKIKD